MAKIKSIEEKAKRYDEVVKKAESLYKAAEPMSGCNVILETIFPELKESEDEKIRKHLIHFFKNKCDSSLEYWEGISKSEALAWLEKQGEQQPADKVEPKFKAGDTIQKKDDHSNKIIISSVDEYFYYANSYNILIKIADKEWELVEQNLNPCDGCIEHKIDYKPESKWYVCIKPINDYQVGECYKMDKYNVICCAEYFRPAREDEIPHEPKFKVGDWVVYDMNLATTCIAEIIDNVGYKTIEDSYNLIKFDEEHWFHLWTIQDAKDGDVLSYRDGQWIFINKGIVDEDTFKYYALLSEKGITVNDAAFLLSSCITPATKEQRETLFKAMADAGYTFDFEKRELKKIEQKTEEYNITGINSKNAQGKLGEMIKNLKPAWSEEDEKKLNEMINRIKQLDHYWNRPTDDKLIDWLKSLKDRYTWKPSEKQMEVLQWCMPLWVEPKSKAILESLINDLKKLREE